MARLLRSPVRQPAPRDGEHSIVPSDPTVLWRIGAVVAGQTAVLTALLLFFGWARTRATFDYFGVDVSLLDLSTTDYVLRSVNSAYHPLLLIGLAVLGGTLLHARLAAPGGNVARLQQIVATGGWALIAIGVSALLIGAWSRRIGGWLPDDHPLGFAWLPATLATGFALLAYATYIARRRDMQRLFVLAVLFLMALFWTVSLFAVHDGRERAQQLERDLATMPEVVLLSRDVLAIRGPGVVLTPLALDQARYRRSYSGLRLLTRSGGKYFLLPVGWRHGRDRVFQVPDDRRIRVELVAH